MEIVFKTKKLRELAKDYRKCQKVMGHRRAKLFHQRLNQLYSAETLEDTQHLPGRYHQLKENYKGHWACDLDHPYRLIFRPVEEPPPIDEHGRIITKQIKDIRIIEIVDYH